MAYVEDRDGKCFARWKGEDGKIKSKKIGWHTRENHASALKIAHPRLFQHYPLIGRFPLQLAGHHYRQD